MKFNFYKYQGTGNDFIILDNRSGEYDQLSEQTIGKLCDRRFGIGADGLMLLNTREGYDFEMIYYNADGQPGSMCGNGGRCLVNFAYDQGLRQEEYSFIASDGTHKARMEEGQKVSLQMKDVSDIKTILTNFTLDTGSPHYVKFVKDVDAVDVVAEGKAIRNSKAYSKEGINVNFVQILSDDTFYVRTYERGVEDETYSCGTGVTAAAIASPSSHSGFNRIEIKTKGGALSVEYDKVGEGEFKNIWLGGPADFVFKGIIEVEDE